jgi:cell division protein FtsB
MPAGAAAVPSTATMIPAREGRSRRTEEKSNTHGREENGTNFHFNLPPVVWWPAHVRIWDCIMAKSRRSCAILLLIAARPRYKRWKGSREETMVRESIETFFGEIKRKIKSAAMPVFLLTLTAIFAWQATQGDHGLIMRERRMAQLTQAETNYAAAKLERDNWQRKVAGLTPSHLDKDALDQRARELLNLADPNEIVVQYGTKEKLF